MTAKSARALKSGFWPRVSPTLLKFWIERNNGLYLFSFLFFFISTACHRPSLSSGSYLWRRASTGAAAAQRGARVVSARCSWANYWWCIDVTAVNTKLSSRSPLHYRDGRLRPRNLLAPLSKDVARTELYLAIRTGVRHPLPSPSMEIIVAEKPDILKPILSGVAIIYKLKLLFKK